MLLGLCACYSLFSITFYVGSYLESRGHFISKRGSDEPACSGAGKSTTVMGWQKRNGDRLDWSVNFVIFILWSFLKCPMPGRRSLPAPRFRQAGSKHESNGFLLLTGEGGDEGGISFVLPSPQSSPPCRGEEVFGLFSAKLEINGGGAGI